MKRLFVGTVPQKREEVIGRNSSNKKIVKRLFKGTVPQKEKRLLVGTVLPISSSLFILVGLYLPITTSLFCGTVPTSNLFPFLWDFFYE